MPEALSAAELAIRIDAVDWDIDDSVRQWHTSHADPMVWTYRFETTEMADFPWSDVYGLAGFSSSQKASVRSGLDRYAEFINVEFVEVTAAAADPDISFYRASEGLFGGRGNFDYYYYFDGPGGSVGTQLWDASVVFNTAQVLDESDADLIIHEIGHAFGLKHTGNYDVGGNLPPGPFLSEAEDNARYSIMSYDKIDPETGEYLSDVGIYDVAALQARFGANMAYNAGNDSYSGPRGDHLEVIWDADGTDTFMGRQSDTKVDIDLREGAFSDMGDAGELVIAYGAVIERAIGSRASDRLAGNHADNMLKGRGGEDRILGRDGNDKLFGQGGDDKLLGGGGDDEIRGSRGDDVLKGGAGDDFFWRDAGDDKIVGGPGVDSFVVKARRSDVTLEEDGRKWVLSHENGTDILVGIEEVVFSNATILL